MSECPCYDNVIADNVVRGSWICDAPVLFMDLQPEPRQRCDMIDKTLKRKVHIGKNIISACR